MKPVSAAEDGEARPRVGPKPGPVP